MYMCTNIYVHTYIFIYIYIYIYIYMLSTACHERYRSCPGWADGRRDCQRERNDSNVRDLLHDVRSWKGWRVHNLQREWYFPTLFCLWFCSWWRHASSTKIGFLPGVYFLLMTVAAWTRLLKMSLTWCHWPDVTDIFEKSLICIAVLRGSSENLRPALNSSSANNSLQSRHSSSAKQSHLFCYSRTRAILLLSLQSRANFLFARQISSTELKSLPTK